MGSSSPSRLEREGGQHRGADRGADHSQPLLEQHRQRRWHSLHFLEAPHKRRLLTLLLCAWVAQGLAACPGLPVRRPTHGALPRRSGHGASLRLALGCACEAGCGLREHHRAPLALPRPRAIQTSLVAAAVMLGWRQPAHAHSGEAAAAALCRRFGRAAAAHQWLLARDSAPACQRTPGGAHGLEELSSKRERARGELSREPVERKCSPRPARVTRRSRSACLSLREQDGSAADSFLEHPGWRASKK
jgi:hypothetical protein